MAHITLRSAGALVMTSTEFTIGFSDEVRASSKVLKPPGGGSSDIFGTHSSQSASRQNDDTRNRLFGSADEQHPVCNKVDHMKSNIFGGPIETPRSAKKYVQRNPITGEVSEIEKIETNNDTGETEEDADTIKDDGTHTPPTPPPRTFVRVRNPPGGKSSGIF